MKHRSRMHLTGKTGSNRPSPSSHSTACVRNCEMYTLQKKNQACLICVTVRQETRPTCPYITTFTMKLWWVVGWSGNTVLLRRWSPIYSQSREDYKTILDWESSCMCTSIHQAMQWNRIAHFGNTDCSIGDRSIPMSKLKARHLLYEERVQSIKLILLRIARPYCGVEPSGWLRMFTL